MAVKSAYIHSSFSNFSGTLNNLAVSQNFDGDFHASILDKLDQLINELKSATDTFLGGMSIEELNKLLYDPQHSPAAVMLKVIRSYLGVDEIFFGTRGLLNQEQIAQMLGGQAQLQDFFAKTGLDAAQEVVRLEEFNTALLNYLGVSANGEYSLEGMISQLSNSSGLAQYCENYITKSMVVSSRKTMSPKLRTFIASANNIDPENFTYDIAGIQNTLSPLFWKEWEKYPHTEALTEEVKALMPSFWKGLKPVLEHAPQITSGSSLSNFLGEEFQDYVINNLYITSDGNSVTFEAATPTELTDRAKETLSRKSKDIINKYGERFTWANENKLGNADTTIILNGRRARVQVKYERAALTDFVKSKNHKGRMKTNIIGAVDKQPIMDFINNLQRQNGVNMISMDADGMAYTIANALWFDMVDSIQFSEFVSVNTDAQSILNDFISALIGNFIGLNIYEDDQQIQIVPEYSTLFYNLGNSVMIPTWTIVENFRNKLLGNGWNDISLSNLGNIKTTAQYTNADAWELLRRKRAKVPHHKSSYIETEARPLGETVGENILNNTIVSSKIQVDFILNKFTSSYLFDE